MATVFNILAIVVMLAVVVSMALSPRGVAAVG